MKLGITSIAGLAQALTERGVPTARGLRGVDLRPLAPVWNRVGTQRFAGEGADRSSTGLAALMQKPTSAHRRMSRMANCGVRPLPIPAVRPISAVSNIGLYLDRHSGRYRWHFLVCSGPGRTDMGHSAHGRVFCLD